MAAGETLTSLSNDTPTVVRLYNSDGRVVCSTDGAVSVTPLAVTDGSDEWVIYPYSGYYYLYSLNAEAFLSPGLDDEMCFAAKTALDVRFCYVADEGYEQWVIDCGECLLGLNSGNDRFVCLADVKDTDNVLFTIESSDRTLTDDENSAIAALLDNDLQAKLREYTQFVTESNAYTAADALPGYIGLYDTSELSADLQDSNVTATQLDAAYNAALLTRLPKAGHYYRLKNFSRPDAGVYTNYVSIQRNDNNTLMARNFNAPVAGVASAGYKEDLCLFSFEYPNAEPYQVKIKAAATDTYFGTANNGATIPVTATQSNAAIFEIEPTATFTRLFRLKFPEQQRWLTISGGKQIVPYNEIEDSEQFYIEEVTQITGITTDANGYKLLQLPCPVRIPEGVEVYVATQKTGAYVLMESVGCTVLAANIPVLLKSNSGGTALTLAVAADSEVDSNIADNLLSGTNVYVEGISHLTVAADNATLFTANESTTIAPNSAYLLDSAASLKMTFDKESLTDIDEIEAAEQTPGEWYDLNGRRVMNPRRGIYIDVTIRTKPTFP